MATVKNVISLAAKLLGIYDRVEGYLSGKSNEENQKAVESLVACFNIVENELAVDYIPIVCEETLLAASGGINYKNFSKKVVYVISVYDHTGKEVDIRRETSRIVLQDGSYVVRYAVAPNEKAIEQSSDYEIGVFERILAYGVAAEYCLQKGLYEEHGVWNKKYKLAIEAAIRIEEENEKRSDRLKAEALAAAKAAEEARKEAEKAAAEAERIAEEKAQAAAKAEAEAQKEAERIQKEKIEAEKRAEEEARKEAEAKLEEEEIRARLADYKTIKARDWL